MTSSRSRRACEVAARREGLRRDVSGLADVLGRDLREPHTVGDAVVQRAAGERTGEQAAPVLHERRPAPRAGSGSRTPLDLARYVARPHLQVAPRGRPGSTVDDLLAQRGLHRRIAVVVPHFLVAPAIVASSELVWTAPAGLAHALAEHYPLAVRPPPLAIPSFAIAMRWHLRLDRDPGLAWLRGMLRSVAPA